MESERGEGCSPKDEPGWELGTFVGLLLLSTTLRVGGEALKKKVT